MSKSSLQLIPLSLAALAFTGCMSSERMARISPLSETDGPKMSESRTNAWPLYYSAGTGVSVLWPFLDFDDSGWAFRPFYASDGDDRSVLWPLSGWDSRSGWALNTYWSDSDYFGMWPFFHWNTGDRYGMNYIIPFWWDNGGKEWGLFPIFGIGSDDWRFLNFYKDDDMWSFWPLAHRVKYDDDHDEWRLLYGVLGGGSSSQGTAWIMPLFYHSDDFSWVFPTFLRTEEWNTLLPFYFYRSVGDDYTLITPIGGIGKYSDGGHLYNFLGPIYINYENPSENYSFISALWPLYIRSRDGDSTFSYTFPLGSKWTDRDGESGRSFLLGLGTTRTKDDETSWALWPFYGHRENYLSGDFRYWLTLAGSESKEYNSRHRRSQHWLFPLYHHWSGNDGTYDEYRFLCYLFGWKTRMTPSGSESFSSSLFPLWFYDSYGTEERRDRYFCIPLIYGFDFDWREGCDKKSWEHWALLNLFNFEKKYSTAIPYSQNSEYQALRETSYSRIINTLWETREFSRWKDGVLTQREQEIIEFAILRYSYPGMLTHMKRRRDDSSVSVVGYEHFDKEIFGDEDPEKLGWEEAHSRRKTFAQKEVTAILRKRGFDIPETTDSAAFQKCLIETLLKFAKDNSEPCEENEFRFWPFYESLDDAFGGYEKELLWGVWYSRGNDEEYFTSCLKYLYRHERTKEGSKLDIFPFISIDTGKRGAFSFLGNFFKIVNDDDEGWSGNFLFIPWGKD